MKKGLMIFLLSIFSVLGINSVSANTSEAVPLTGTYEATNYYFYFDKHIEGYETYKDNINHLIDYWENNHSSEYPFYFIIGDYVSMVNSDECIYVYTLYSTNSTDFVLKNGSLHGLGSSFDGNEYVATYQYSSDTNEYIYSDILRSYQYSLAGSSYIIDSNISPTFKQQEYKYYQSGILFTEDFDTIHLPSFNSETTSLFIPEIEIKDKDKIPTLMSLYDGSYVADLTSKYTEINLNDYSYVILSLKDYTPRETFTTNMYIKGQVCPTTLYNYGSEEKKDYISGWQSPGCNTYLEDYTLNSNYIREEDITNHAVYYLNAFDTSKPNSIKVDTSVYNITYITAENEDNPSVSIDGKIYSSLPYSSLTDTSVNTEINGINPSWTCAKYDTDCFLDSSGININDLFSKPLDTLETIWGTISSVFKLITEFITLLPPIMQGFLYLAFAVGISIGIIKIIL